MTKRGDAFKGESTNLNGVDLATGRAFPSLGSESAVFEDGKSLVAASAANNQYGRMYVLANVGDKNLGHSHTYEHLTWIVRGSVRATADNIQMEFKAPFVLNIPAGVEHEFEALEPNTTYICTHVVRGNFNEDNPGTLIGQLTGKSAGERFSGVRG